MRLQDRLRKMAVAVYLAAEAGPAADISEGLKQAADEIDAIHAEVERLRHERDLYRALVNIITDEHDRGTRYMSEEWLMQANHLLAREERSR